MIKVPWMKSLLKFSKTEKLLLRSEATTVSRFLMTGTSPRMKNLKKSPLLNNHSLDKNFSTNNFASVLGLETIAEAFFLC